jgi:hypothetical protein
MASESVHKAAEKYTPFLQENFTFIVSVPTAVCGTRFRLSRPTLARKGRRSAVGAARTRNRPPLVLPGGVQESRRDCGSLFFQESIPAVPDSRKNSLRQSVNICFLTEQE